MKLEEKIEEILRRGGFGFWVLCLVFSLFAYLFLYFFMALGVAAGY